MPRNGSGLYVPPPANYPAVPATLIIAANRNAIDADIATALTNSIAVNGESVVTADIPFGNNKLTGVKDGTLAKDAANVSQIQNSNAILLATVAGTDTITASLSPALTAYANGQIFTLIPANTNTGAVTININGLGAKSITKNGSTALVAGDLVAGVEYSLQYDGTRFQKVAGSDYAKSGANSDITSLSGLTSALTGTQLNTLGTVTATGTYPSLTATGAIIETGTNANGTYIKYANGRMECYRTLDMPPQALNTQASATGAWAAPFASLESVQFSPYGQIGSGSAAKIGLMHYNGLFSSGSTITDANIGSYSYRAATDDSADSVRFHVIGYGRWA